MDTSDDTPVQQFTQMTDNNVEEVSYKRVPCPPHRFRPLQENWMEICAPLVENMKLLVRFNTKNRGVELKSTPDSTPNAIEKGSDYLTAFMLGFDLSDALTLLRVDNMFIDSFEIKDVKTLHGEHLSRAIGRIAGQGGKTKYTIENATKTRIVIADTHIHILGSFENIKISKTAICNLIMGSPSGKVYTQMRGVANRMKNRY